MHRGDQSRLGCLPDKVTQVGTAGSYRWSSSSSSPAAAPPAVRIYFVRNLFWTKRILSCDDGVERISCSWKESNVFINAVEALCSCCPRQSTPPSNARALGAARDSGRAGTIVARGGAAGFGAPALVPTVAISKPVTPGLLNSARSRVRATIYLVRGPMPCFRMRASWFAPCVLLPPNHRRRRCSVSAGCAERYHRGLLLAAPSPTARSSRRGTCARLNQRPGHGRTPNTMRCSHR